MKAEGILETCLYVDDLDAAERFYRDVLGLEPFSRSRGRHVFFRCGPQVFLVFRPEATRRTDESGPGVPPHGAEGPGHVAFALNEEDVARWREHLEKNGVGVETEIAWPAGGYSIYFRDPAGNSVELATPRMWRPEA
jgi:catechol 2,3-dioxygenase-like lactoylglutathione lyase family enzyme